MERHSNEFKRSLDKTPTILFSPRMLVCMLKLLQSCPTLCDPVDCSLLGSSVHGTLQARIPERAALSSSRGSAQPRDRVCVSYLSCVGRRVSLPLEHLGSHYFACTALYSQLSEKKSSSSIKILKLLKRE